MPDLLTHYAVSFLIASRVTSLKRSSLLALAGLLPDVDALLRIHRSVTHSLVLTGALALAVVYVAYRGGWRYTPILAVAAALYMLHIVMDLFTAPTPILWPLTKKAYMLNPQLNIHITSSHITLTPSLEARTTPVDFTQKHTMEAPIASATGVVAAIAVAAALFVERIVKASRELRVAG